MGRYDDSFFPGGLPGMVILAIITYFFILPVFQNIGLINVINVTGQQNQQQELSAPPSQEKDTVILYDEICYEIMKASKLNDIYTDEMLEEKQNESVEKINNLIAQYNSISETTFMGCE